MATHDAPYEIRYPSGNKVGVLCAYNMTEARELVHTFPDSIIVRVEDGAWMDMPLCKDRRLRLAKVHCFLRKFCNYVEGTPVIVPELSMRQRKGAGSFEQIAEDYLKVASELIPDHIATDPDHEYGRKEDALRKALGLAESS